MEVAVFGIFAALAVASALMVVANRNPVYSTMSLVVTLLSTAVLFVLLGSPFLAILQVLLYTGAILVLFLFVIMLLDLRGEARPAEAHPVQKGMGILLFAAFLLAGAGTVLVQRLPGDGRLVKPAVEDLGRLLFTRYLLPFEAVTLLLLAAAVGAFLLARKEWK